jgi:hypothetical protein
MSQMQHEGVSKTNESSNLENENAVDEGQKQTTDYRSLYEQSQSSIKRLTEESKKYKTRHDKLTTMESELESLKMEKLEREGNMDEKVSFYKSKYDEAVNENRNLKTDLVFGKLERRFKNIAPDCQKPSMVINNPEYENDIRAAIDTDNLTVDSEVLKSLYAKDKEANPFLYTRNKPASMVAGGAKADTKKVGEIDESKMSADELREYYVNKFK